ASGHRSPVGRDFEAGERDLNFVLGAVIATCDESHGANADAGERQRTGHTYYPRERGHSDASSLVWSAGTLICGTGDLEFDEDAVPARHIALEFLGHGVGGSREVHLPRLAGWDENLLEPRPIDAFDFAVALAVVGDL